MELPSLTQGHQAAAGIVGGVGDSVAESDAAAATASSATAAGSLLPPLAGAPAFALRRSFLGAGGDQLEAVVFQKFSRFNRDRSCWIAVSDAVLWQLAVSAIAAGKSSEAEKRQLRCWSCGCSSGEEAYYLKMLWKKRLQALFPEVDLDVLGTDLCHENIDAACRGVYPAHSVEGSLPAAWLQEFFEVPEDFSASQASSKFSSLSSQRDPYGAARREKIQLDEARARRRRAAAAALGALAAAPLSGGGCTSASSSSSSSVSAAAYKSVPSLLNGFYRLKDPDIISSVDFVTQDATKDMPDGPFDVILSRYAVCLYLEGEQKNEVLAKMMDRLRPGGFLVLGGKDKLPAGFCERHGLTAVAYRTVTESCPFGPAQLVEGLFQKCLEASPTSGLPPPSTAADERLGFSYLQDYLKSAGMDADWVAERDKMLRERLEKKIIGKSKVLLERAIKEGRREADASLMSRMKQDFEQRQERAKARESEKALQVEEAASLGSSLALTKEAAAAKISSFFERMGKDMAHREASVVAKQKEQDKSIQQALRRSRSSTSSAGLASGKSAKKRKNRPASASVVSSRLVGSKASSPSSRAASSFRRS
eukprot:TRINITY_DN28294_c0_g1_i1.p1 TRINITY_DN28294_c0_g1~~TRINITY_DN28294_c0_g1_i1.p1  ORF type:complete len:633 (-),score=177.85 TRINITY_DN28294_c0_g1_i1:249-2030(-)